LDYGKVPWLKVHEYLLKVESCRTLFEFLHTASAEISDLIPFDFTGLHSTAEARVLVSIGLSDTWIASYNEYYRTRQPGSPTLDSERWDFGYLLSTPIVEWRKYQNLDVQESCPPFSKAPDKPFSPKNATQSRFH